MLRGCGHIKRMYGSKIVKKVFESGLSNVKRVSKARKRCSNSARGISGESDVTVKKTEDIV